MKLHSLKLRNFRQHVSTDIVFGQGITGIIGPNGAGKTTILEAVAFALYASGRTSREQMLSIAATGRQVMKVELEFDLGKHRYRVIRTRTGAELFLDSEPSPIANSPSSVSERLQRLLGMSRDEFFRTYFTSQKELALMATLGASDRARFLSKVLGYEKLRFAQDMIVDKRKVLGAEIQGLRQGMPDPETVERALTESRDRVTTASASSQTADHRYAVVSGTLKMIAPRWELAQKNREKAQAIAVEITSNEREEATLSRNVERVTAELQMVAESRAELSRLHESLEPLAELRAELTILDDLYREEGRRRTLVEAEVALRDEIDKARLRAADIETAAADEPSLAEQLVAKQAELEKISAEFEAKRIEWVRDKQEAETKLRDLRRQYSEVQDQRNRVISLGADGACPTCSRKLGKNLDTVVEHLTETLDTLKVDGDYYRKRNEQLAETPPLVRDLEEKKKSIAAEAGNLERRHALAQVAVKDLAGIRADIDAKEKRLDGMRRDISVIARGFDAARYELVKGEIARLVPLESRAARLGALLDREPQLLEQQQEHRTSLNTVLETLGTLRMRHKQMSFASADFDRLKAEYERCYAETRAAELEANTAKGNLRNAEESLKKAITASEESQTRQVTVAQREDEKRLHEELDRAFNEMRGALNTALRPELSELATSFLRELLDSRTAELELDERYNVSVLEDGIAKPVLSGGEEDLANLVLRLAVSQMIAERSGQAFSLLILDEVFGSLDEMRRFNVVELLRALGDRFEQVILITHIESVREGLDQVISVRYDPSIAASVVQQMAGGGEATSGGVDPDAQLDLTDAVAEIRRAG